MCIAGLKLQGFDPAKWDRHWVSMTRASPVFADISAHKTPLGVSSPGNCRSKTSAMRFTCRKNFPKKNGTRASHHAKSLSIHCFSLIDALYSTLLPREVFVSPNKIILCYFEPSRGFFAANPAASGAGSSIPELERQWMDRRLGVAMKKGTGSAYSVCTVFAQFCTLGT
jgi:hypothetical protein